MHNRSTHTNADLSQIEQDTGLTFAGFVNLGAGGLIPVYVNPQRNRDERHAIVRRLNASESKD